MSGYSGFLRNLPTNTTIFFATYAYVEKADLSKDYQNPKRKLGVTTHFSKIIEPKFWKEIDIHSLYFNALFRIIDD